MTSYFEEFTHAEAVLWNKYLNHPWMNGIREGSLTSDQFQFFLVQDMPYQRDFLNALLITSTRVVDPQTFLTLRDFIAAEVDFEADLLDSAGIPWTFERWAAGPSREAYMNHLTRVAMEGTPGQVCAALLPCAAGFTGAMAEPSPKSSHPVIYQKWLEFYERPEQFSFSSALVRTFENEMAEAPATEIAHCKMIFTRSVQHQISVLDAAWRTEDRWQ